VGDARGVHHLDGVQLDVGAREVFEQPCAVPEKHGRDVQLQLVDQARRKVLLGDVGAAAE
jgi:hypothetical protein